MNKILTILLLFSLFSFCYGDGHSHFDEDEAITLETTNIVVSIFSLLGSIFIIFCYIVCKDLRSFAFSLVFYVSVADFFFSIGNLFGDAGGNPDTYIGANDELCTTQAVMIAYFELASLLWSVSIAYSLYMAFLKQDPRFSSQNIGNLTKYYSMVCWGAPIPFVLLPFTTDSYGDTGGWCWIETANDETDAGTAWRFTQYYIPLWIAVGFNSYVYYYINRKLKAMAAAAPSAGSHGRAKMMSRMKYYPLVLVVCNTPATINALYEAFGGELVLWLNVIHVMFASSQGLANALVYGFTPSVRKHFMAWVRGEEYKEFETQTSAGQGDSTVVGRSDRFNSDGDLEDGKTRGPADLVEAATQFVSLRDVHHTEDLQDEDSLSEDGIVNIELDMQRSNYIVDEDMGDDYGDEEADQVTLPIDTHQDNEDERQPSIAFGNTPRSESLLNVQL